MAMLKNQRVDVFPSSKPPLTSGSMDVADAGALLLDVLMLSGTFIAPLPGERPGLPSWFKGPGCGTLANHS